MPDALSEARTHHGEAGINHGEAGTIWQRFAPIWDSMASTSAFLGIHSDDREVPLEPFGAPGRLLRDLEAPRGLPESAKPFSGAYWLLFQLPF